MADPNIDATPQSVADELSGTDGNGVPLSYAKAAMLFDARMFGLSKDYAFPEPANTSSSRLDQITTLAKLLTRTMKLADGNDYTVWDAIMTMAKYVVLEDKHINDDEVNSVNYVKPVTPPPA